MDWSVRRRLRILGPVSVLVFCVPLVAPLLQAMTFGDALLAARRRTADRLSVALAALGAVLGFLLFLATEYLWVV